MLSAAAAWSGPPHAYPKDVTVTKGKVKVVFDLEADGPVPLWPVASADGGATWNVRMLSASGAVGEKVAPGPGKEITWDSAADYPDGFDVDNLMIDLESNAQLVGAIAAYKAEIQQQGVKPGARTFEIKNAERRDPAEARLHEQRKEALLRVEARLTQVKPLPGSAGDPVRILHANAVVTGHRVTVTFDLEASSPVPVWLIASDDSGATWNVLTASAVGDVGPAVAPGPGKKIEWDATADYPDGIGIGNIVADLASDRELVAAMEEYGRRVKDLEEARRRSAPPEGEASAAPADKGAALGELLDSLTRPFLFVRPGKGPSPVVVTDAQVEGTKVYVTYDLQSTRPLPLWLIASFDGGRTWSVRTYALEGEVGERIEPGEGRTVVWDAYTDYPEGVEVEGLLLDFTRDEAFGKKMFLYRKVLAEIEGFEEVKYEAEDRLGLAAETAGKGRALAKRAAKSAEAAKKTAAEGLLGGEKALEGAESAGLSVLPVVTDESKLEEAAKKAAKAKEISGKAAAMRKDAAQMQREAEAAIEEADRNIERLSGELRDRRAEVAIYYGWVGPGPLR